MARADGCVRLVETVGRFGESIVVAIANAADRRLDARLRQALGVSNADVLAASVAMVHEPAAMDRHLPNPWPSSGGQQCSGLPQSLRVADPARFKISAAYTF